VSRQKRLVITIALALLGGFAWIWWLFTAPFGRFDQPVTVVFDHGTSSREMARVLAERGVIRYRWLFWLLRAARPHVVLRAGEYEFTRPASVVEVFDRIVRGDVRVHAILIPEGSTMFEVARIVGQLGWISEQEFLAVAEDPSLVRDLAPQAPNLEGYLFPSTYYVTRDMDAREIASMMVRQFRKVWRELGGPDDRVHEIVTVASMVEKETAIPQERPLIASVLWNRLRRGMRLECDPTVIYAATLEGHYRGRIYRSDLDRVHPYNTYQQAGLPPGPIANPGRAALEAALRPAHTDYLFFVALPDGSGAHAFSRSLEDHNHAVARYRRARRQALRQEKARTVSERTAARPGPG